MYDKLELFCNNTGQRLSIYLSIYLSSIYLIPFMNHSLIMQKALHNSLNYELCHVGPPRMDT